MFKIRILDNIAARKVMNNDHPWSYVEGRRRRALKKKGAKIVTTVSSETTYIRWIKPLQQAIILILEIM